MMMHSDVKPSESAQGVAAIRYAATLETDPNIRLTDPLSHCFLNLKYRLLAGPLRKLSKHLYSTILPGIYESIIVRTKHYDTILMDSIDQGIEQLVLLGAGYDTRAYRFSDELENNDIKVFELDHPSTQKRKLQALPRELHRQSVIHVPIDFNHNKTDQVLVESGFESNKSTLFLCEGVTMYLSQEAVHLMLAAISRSSTSGAYLAFDCCDSCLLDGTNQNPIVKKHVRFLAKRGEPTTWSIAKEELPSLLQDSGFHLLNCWSGKQLRDKYQIKTDNEQLEQLLSSSYVVKASVI